MKKNILNIIVILLITNVYTKGYENFSTSIDSAITISGGNSESLQSQTTLKIKGYTKQQKSITIGANANYEQYKQNNKKEIGTANARLFVNYKKHISPKWFASLDNYLLYNHKSRIDYRAIIAPGIGVYLWQTKQIIFSLNASPAYILEKQTDNYKTYPAFRLAQEGIYTINPSLQIEQHIHYIPKATNFEDYLIHTEITLKSKISKKSSLIIMLKNEYDSNTEQMIQNNDYTLMCGIRLSL